MDRLTSMSVFVRAAELGSFTAAAATLGISSQMVGKHVGFLEARLGGVLLQRSTRRQSLTELGRVFYARCRATLAEADAAEAAGLEFSAAPRGRLKITAPVTFGSLALLPVITKFLDTHRQVEIGVDLSDRYVDLIGEGYDAAIRLGPLRDSALHARALASYRLIACAAPAYLAEHGTPRTPADLVDHECLGFLNASGLPFGDWRFARDGRIDAVAVRSRLHVNDARVLRQAALDGRGIVLQADLLVAGDIAAGRLVQVLGDYEAPIRPLQIVFSATRPPSSALRAFIDAVVAAFPPR